MALGYSSVPITLAPQGAVALIDGQNVTDRLDHKATSHARTAQSNDVQFASLTCRCVVICHRCEHGLITSDVLDILLDADVAALLLAHSCFSLQNADFSARRTIYSSLFHHNR